VRFEILNGLDLPVRRNHTEDWTTLYFGRANL
jgi:hypothetical protein